MDWLSFGLPNDSEADLIAGHLVTVPSVHFPSSPPFVVVLTKS